MRPPRKHRPHSRLAGLLLGLELRRALGLGLLLGRLLGRLLLRLLGRAGLAPDGPSLISQSVCAPPPVRRVRLVEIGRIERRRNGLHLVRGSGHDETEWRIKKKKKRLITHLDVIAAYLISGRVYLNGNLAARRRERARVNNQKPMSGLAVRLAWGVAVSTAMVVKSWRSKSLSAGGCGAAVKRDVCGTDKLRPQGPPFSSACCRSRRATRSP